MISNERMDKLTAIANLMEVGRLAIIGDRKQLMPVDAGKSFSVMQARAIQDQLPVSEVKINMRQKTEDMRLVADRSDEHTSELQSLMRISYAVFCLKNKKEVYPHNGC